MINLPGSLFCVFALFVQVASNDPNAALLRRIQLSIGEQRAGWLCAEFRSDDGVRTPQTRGGQGRGYQTQCASGEKRIFIFLFVGERPEDAVRELRWSQESLSQNRSRPMTGVGEQGYQYANNLGAWITFRQGVMFAQIDAQVRRDGASISSVSEAEAAELLAAAKNLGVVFARAAGAL